DALAHSSAELGVLFISLVLISGSVWTKPANGVWWTWDPRLTTTLILWLIYVGYLMLRAYSPTPLQAARYSAVMGIVGFVDVPIVYFSAVWWKNIVHPVLYVGPLAEGSLDSQMAFGLMVSLITFTALLVYMLWERLSLHTTENALREIRYQERTG
ncbi:cytochrome c biogenesis protein, partial [Dehalococcoidia bacterium]|nr:cytochrome c biogenesis protein [Dehalococcoidia bacterium]